jgi:hypothetical protein
VLANANQPVNQVGQGVIQEGIQTMIFHLSDVHRLNPKIEEDMGFRRWLSVKQFWKVKSAKTYYRVAVISTFETIAS